MEPTKDTLELLKIRANKSRNKYSLYSTLKNWQKLIADTQNYNRVYNWLEINKKLKNN